MNKSFVRTSGADTYTLRGSTLVEGYFPGPMRQNFLQDPDKVFGSIDFGTFGSDQNYNGPGTLTQAIPDASRYQYAEYLAVPRPNPNRLFQIDDRQIDRLQVEQLNNNPLSQYTTNPNGVIPGFECQEEPGSYANMVNKRTSDFENFFDQKSFNEFQGATPVPGRAAGSAINVYQQYSGQPTNPNANVVYNLSLNSKETVNPMIAVGSPSVAASVPQFGGKCYSGKFVPGQQISLGGPNPPSVYSNYKLRPREQSDVGMQNGGTSTICEPDRSLNFVNPLII